MDRLEPNSRFFSLRLTFQEQVLNRGQIYQFDIKLGLILNFSLDCFELGQSGLTFDNS